MKGLISSILCVVLGLSACTPIGPNYAAPDVPVPDSWNFSIRSGLDSSSPDIERWWLKFNDPTLNKLIGIAETENRDLAIAAERV